MDKGNPVKTLIVSKEGEAMIGLALLCKNQESELEELRSKVALLERLNDEFEKENADLLRQCIALKKEAFESMEYDGPGLLARVMELEEQIQDMEQN